MKGKWMAIKANWAEPDKYDRNFNAHQTNVEAEDRVYVNADASGVGFFNYTNSKATIKNLKLTNRKISTHAWLQNTITTENVLQKRLI